MGFKYSAKNRRPLNVANSYNYPHAFIEENGHYLINYPQIVYSRGHIATPEGVQVVSKAGGVVFSWLPQSQSAYCQYTDLATFVIYNPEKNNAVTEINVVDRYSLKHAVVLPLDFPGDTVHCYMNFASANGMIMGDSVYVGTVEIL